MTTFVKCKHGNKLPGKLQYTSVSIHRRDSHVRGSFAEGRNVQRRVNRLRKLKSNAVKRAADANGEELKGTKTSGTERERGNSIADAMLAKLSFILTIVDITRYRARRRKQRRYEIFIYYTLEIFSFKPYFKYIECLEQRNEYYATYKIYY